MKRLHRHLLGRLTLSCSKSCRRKVATVAVMPMKRLMTMRNTYAVLGTSNQKDAGYMMGVMDHLKGTRHQEHRGGANEVTLGHASTSSVTC